MLTIQRLATLMELTVHRIDGHVPHNVDYYDGTEDVDEGIDVYYRVDEGKHRNVWIDSIVRVDDDGVIHCRDNFGYPVEVEIFERMKSFE